MCSPVSVILASIETILISFHVKKIPECRIIYKFPHTVHAGIKINKWQDGFISSWCIAT